MVVLGVGILALPRFVEDDPWWGQDSLMTQVTFCSESVGEVVGSFSLDKTRCQTSPFFMLYVLY